jgi:hypothetical protein
MSSPKLRVRRLLKTPQVISRTLMLIDGHSYAAMYELIEITDEKGEIRNEYHLSIIRDDGTRYSDAPAVVASPLSDLGMEIKVKKVLSGDADLSGYLSSERADAYIDAGYRSNAADVFQRIKDVVNRFIDFSKSFAKQEIMCELIACYIISTYFLDAFDDIGYLCANGGSGSGKTKLICIVGELSCLGKIITASSTFATLRNFANQGSTIVFDDADSLMAEKQSEEHRKLKEWFLVGSSKGKKVTYNEKWEIIGSLKVPTRFARRYLVQLRSLKAR